MESVFGKDRDSKFRHKYRAIYEASNRLKLEPIHLPRPVGERQSRPDCLKPVLGSKYINGSKKTDPKLGLNLGQNWAENLVKISSKTGSKLT